MKITGLYAALLALMMMTLAFRVSLLRNRYKIGVGDGGSTPMNLAIRTHANAIEYVPMAVILLLILELNQTRPVLLHAFGVTLLVARLAHAVGLTHSAGTSPGRLIGAALTLLVIVVMALLLIWQFVLIRLISPV